MKMLIYLVCLLVTLGFSISQAAEKISSENAQWEIFTNRQWITAFSAQPDNNILWVATDGGLEKRDTRTSQVSQIFTTKEGLPGNSIETILQDSSGGLWVATSKNGIAYRNSVGVWTTFNTENSKLPSDFTTTLFMDKQGRLWVGTMEGLAYYQNDGTWTEVFAKGEFDLPDVWIESMLVDNQGGLWVGTQQGYLYYRDSVQQWTVFSSENSPLPINGGIRALLEDGRGGIWIGMYGIQQDKQFIGGGLGHRDSDGTWQFFDPDNSRLLGRWITSLLSDDQGGLWIGTLDKGLFHFTTTGEWLAFANPHLPSKGVTSLGKDSIKGLWVGSFWGVSYFNVNQEWSMPETNSTTLPGNQIYTSLIDQQGRIWIGTLDGLAYYDTYQWTIFNSLNGFPANKIFALSLDDTEGLWVGTNNGLIHRQANGEFTHFNAENSQLPYNNVTTLVSDGQGGVWLGAIQDMNADKLVGSGLVHLDKQGQWTVFNTDNSQLPYNAISTLVKDGQNGLWIGALGMVSVKERTGGGLAHLTHDNQWTIFTIENSLLPSNNIETLLLDGRGGLWIGTSFWDTDHQGGLAFLSADQQWKIFDTTNSKLTMDWITALLDDGNGGIWIGTPKGLLHRSPTTQWTVFDTHNSGLPDRFISTLSRDTQGSLWVGTLQNGLARLTFGNKTALCQQVATAQCQDLQNKQRAAIVIAGGGAQSGNTLWDTTEFITNYIYNVLINKGFDNDEIYYLNAKGWADFNGDGFDDQITDAPKPARAITAADVKQAFEWAKNKGKLGIPLYLFFIDHGSVDKLLLSKIEAITATEFKTLLDDYQEVTQNDVVVLIDACYSGSFSQRLMETRFRRDLISSTQDTVAYFDRENKQAFSRFFVKQLDRGSTFREAFKQAVTEQGNLLEKISQRLSPASIGNAQNLEQVPQFVDGSQGELAKQALNNFPLVTGDDSLAIESAMVSQNMLVGQPVALMAKTMGKINRVWAVVRPPSTLSC